VIANIAFGVLIITLTVTIVSIVMAAYGAMSKSGAMMESARLASLVTFPLLSLILVALVILLVTGRFEYAYVYQTTDAAMPVYLKIAAIWGGQEGSLLFWCWLLSGFTFVSLVNKGKIDQELMPWVIVVTSITLAFFLFLVLFFENPFFRFFINYEGEVDQITLQVDVHHPSESRLWNGDESAFTAPRDGGSPADVVPRICRFHHPIRVCYRDFDQRLE